MANIDIGGRLHSTATGNVVAGANEILDDNEQKKQSQINQELRYAQEELEQSIESGLAEKQDMFTVNDPTITENGGQPSAEALFEDNQLSLAFYNIKGDRGNGIASSSEELSEIDGDYNTHTIVDDDGVEHVFHTRNGKTGKSGDTAVYDENNPPVKVATIKTTLGNSQTDTMTQKAITDALVENTIGEWKQIASGQITVTTGMYAKDGKFTSSSAVLHTIKSIEVNKGDVIKVKVVNADFSSNAADVVSFSAAATPVNNASETPLYTTNEKNLEVVVVAPNDGYIHAYFKDRTSGTRSLTLYTPVGVVQKLSEESQTRTEEIASIEERLGAAESGLEDKVSSDDIKVNVDAFNEDFSIEDENNCAIALFKNGHIKTKNFNSEDIKEGNLSEELQGKINDIQKPVPKGFVNALAAMKRFKASSSNDILKLNNHSQYAAIVHITDMHGDAVRTETAFECAKQLNAGVVCTGDIVMYNGTDDFEWLKTIVGKYPTVQYDQALGNHEMRYFTNESGYNKFVAPLYDGQGWILPSGVSNPLYYYRDDATYKLRYISLCQWEDDGDANHNFPLMKQAQINFLIDTLSNIPADYGVIILMHSPENKPVKDANYPKFFSKSIIYNQDFDGVPSVQEIIDAFISKTTISKTVGSIEINADFSQVASNEFIAYMCGHYHADAVHLASGTDNRQVVLTETCTCAWVNKNSDGSSGTSYPKYTEFGDLARQIGTENENAFNVYVIDRENHLIKIVRIGSDLPCDLGERRDYMTIKYIND